MSDIKLVISDVDGTLLTENKSLPASARKAVGELHEAGVLFTVTSARPPRGEKKLVERLRLTHPIGSFNGAVMAEPDGNIVQQHRIGVAAGEKALAQFAAAGLDVWLYTAHDWFASNLKGVHVAEESKTVHFSPKALGDARKLLADAVKLVGVSDDDHLTERVARVLKLELGNEAQVSMSKSCFVEVMHPKSNKGAVVEFFCRRYAISPEHIAAIGDGENDVRMFEKAGLSIAMGSAPLEVKDSAGHVTASAEHDGFAHAIRSHVLAEARRGAA